VLAERARKVRLVSEAISTLSSSSLARRLGAADIDARRRWALGRLLFLVHLAADALCREGLLGEGGLSEPNSFNGG
jgi:hypothetical protein